MSEERLEHGLSVAWRYLNRRDRTVGEMRLHLEAKGVEAATVDQVVDELAGGGYLDDARFAERFAEDRRSLDGWGSERISRRLAALGVSSELIEAALGDRTTADEVSAAVEVLKRRVPVPPDDARERNRAFGILVRRGYDADTAGDAIRAYARGDEL